MNLQQEISQRKDLLDNWKVILIIVPLSLVVGILSNIILNKVYMNEANNKIVMVQQITEKAQKEIEETRKKAEAAQVTAESAIKIAGTTWGSVAIINLSSPEGYNFLNTKNGVFYVSLRDTAKYLDGYKLILDIGNPSNATYNGFELKAVWPKALLPSLEALSNPPKPQKEKTQSFTKNLMPGRWNRVEFIVTPFDNTDDLIGLTMTTNQVILLN